MVDAPVAIEYAFVSLVESLPKINTTSRRKHRPNSIASSLFRLRGVENRLQIVANIGAFVLNIHSSHVFPPKTTSARALENAFSSHLWNLSNPESSATDP
jgi:hypothetical protein